MGKEWYLVEYEEKTYLHNKRLAFLDFPCMPNFHDHCELCWARFSNLPDDLHNGYYESTSKSWICPSCFSELSPLFGWTVDNCAKKAD